MRILQFSFLNIVEFLVMALYSSNTHNCILRITLKTQVVVVSLMYNY